MKRMSSILFVGLLLGCSNVSPTMQAEDPRQETWQNSLYQATLAVCRATHRSFLKKRWPVDCQTPAPHRLWMGFPSKEFYEKDQSKTDEFLSVWCRSAQYLLKEKPAYQLFFLEEDEESFHPCVAERKN